MKKRVVVGLSGGVDSSVAAFLLKEQGYDVTAVFMVNWHDRTGVLKGDCPWDEDVTFAEMVAKKLDIPFHVVDLSAKYRERVVEYMFREYEAGRTPNPDVLCNREIKFDEFFSATEKFNPDFIATGHYCSKDEIVIEGKKLYRLLQGRDPGKEQSYFLCQLSQIQLARTLFPIGHLLKSEVRRIALEQKLPSAHKKDSQGICFVGKVDLPTFLQQKLESKTGQVIEIPAEGLSLTGKSSINGDFSDYQPRHFTENEGFVTGEHPGAHFFTVGQRKGLNIGGKKEPLFVLQTNTERNVVYVGQGQDHPGLYRDFLRIRSDDIHWVRPDLEMAIGQTKNFQVRIRYRQPLQEAELIRREQGIIVRFGEPQRGIAGGQFAAWYHEGELIGSGIIEE